jgi:hypothetical protein
MIRLLTLMMIFVLVLAHGSSVAAAICRHQDGVEHVAALQSSDAGISAAAFNEESAGKAASKKGAPVDSASVSLASDMLPMPEVTVPFRTEDPVDRALADASVLLGGSIPPLLEPPSA